MAAMSMRRTLKQMRKRLDEIQEHGFVDKWVEPERGIFLVFAPLPYGPYTLKEMDAWLECADAMGVGGTQ
jgi:hypothetical protein